MLSRKEVLLLVLYTAPTKRQHRPAIVGATRLQKLVFLATRESAQIAELSGDMYHFIPFDYGPYSNRLERDVDRLVDAGVAMRPGSPVHPNGASELTFAYLTSHLNRPQPDSCVVLGEHGTILVKQILARLEKEGFDSTSILKEFEQLHGRFTGLNLEELLRYVYGKYPEYAANTKRPDLRSPEHDAEEVE